MSAILSIYAKKQSARSENRIPLSIKQQNRDMQYNPILLSVHNIYKF